VRGSNCTISSRNCACGACLSNVPLLKTSFERIDGEVHQDSDVRRVQGTFRLQNANVERIIGSIRSKCLDHIIVR
jgi:hypothetical protein